MATMETHAEQPGGKQQGMKGEAMRGEGGRGEEEAHKEGPIARTIEEQTAKLPSDVFLWAAVASIGASMAFQIMGTRRGILDVFRPARAPIATFVGQWAPTFLLLGIYNKIVKVAGSDRAASRSGGMSGQGGASSQGGASGQGGASSHGGTSGHGGSYRP